MALSEKQKQKKWLQKAQKRKKAMVAKQSGGPAVSPRGRVRVYARFPIHETLCPDDLYDQGIGNLVLSREAPDGMLGVSMFLVDVFCLGVKNAFFAEMDPDRYMEVKYGMSQNHPEKLEDMEPACFCKLVEGATDYARDLGFSPHKDYAAAKALFGDIDAAACPTEFVFGQDGKPFFVSGPNDNSAKSRKIVKQLEKRCGEGGYDYLVELDDERMLREIAP